MVFPGIVDQSRFAKNARTERLVLHLDGTSFNDLSVSNHLVTNNGYILENGSYFCDGSLLNNLEIPNNEDFSFGDKNFFIETKVKIAAINYVNTLASQINPSGSTNNGSFLFSIFSGKLFFGFVKSNNQYIRLNISLPNTDYLTEYKIFRVERVNDLLFFFYDGLEVNSYTIGSIELYDSLYNLIIGNYSLNTANSSFNRSLNGFIDYFKIGYLIF